jgi:Flp pilus assembly protein CpaB
MKTRRGGLILILLGLVLASAAGLSVFQLSQKSAQAAKVEMVKVVVLAQDVPERMVIEAGSLAVKTVPVELVPPGAISEPSEAIGKMSSSRLYAGEVLLAAKLASTNGQSGLSYTLAPGQVVITWPASDIITTGAVHAGDTVDVLVTRIPPDKTGPTGEALTKDPVTTQTTMQNLRVLAVGSVESGVQSSDSKGNSAPTLAPLVTFAVGHQDAVVLKALKDSQQFKLEMVLRAAGDDKAVNTEPVTLDSLLEKYQLRPQQ